MQWNKLPYDSALDEGGGGMGSDASELAEGIMGLDTHEFIETSQLPLDPVSMPRLNSQLQTMNLMPSHAYVQGSPAENYVSTYPHIRSASTYNPHGISHNSPQYGHDSAFPPSLFFFETNRMTRPYYEPNSLPSVQAIVDPAQSASFASAVRIKPRDPDGSDSFCVSSLHRSGGGPVDTQPWEVHFEDGWPHVNPASRFENPPVFNLQPNDGPGGDFYGSYDHALVPLGNVEIYPSTPVELPQGYDVTFGGQASYGHSPDAVPWYQEGQQESAPTHQLRSQQPQPNDNGFLVPPFDFAFEPIGVGTAPQRDMEQNPAYTIEDGAGAVPLPSAQSSAHHRSISDPEFALQSHAFPYGSQPSTQPDIPSNGIPGSVYTTPETISHVNPVSGTSSALFPSSASPRPARTRPYAKSSFKSASLSNFNHYLSPNSASHLVKKPFKQCRAKPLAIEDIPSDLQPWHHTRGRHDIIPDDKYKSLFRKDGGLFVCIKCHHRLQQRRKMNEHISAHLGHRPYSCLHCGKRYPRMENHSANDHNPVWDPLRTDQSSLSLNADPA